MKIFIVYFIVILFSNTFGALSGMGGGVIIKPALDAVGYHSLSNINFFSSAAVFVMSIVSIIKQVRSGFKINLKLTISIASGSIFGGILGDYIFSRLLTVFSNESNIQMIQIVLTVISLILVLIFLRSGIESYEWTNLLVVFFVGLFLGTLSTLLGIGGGPINVATLIFCFSIPLKQATVYSIITIFFSQFSKLVSVAINEGFMTYDLIYLCVIIPAAIMGGFLGSHFNQQLSVEKVTIYYRLVTLGVIILNIINGVRLIFYLNNS